MAVFCWGELAKSANDPVTIAEYIQARILEHNISPSAHGLNEYAIYNHRTDGELDHADDSVVHNKIRTENVYNEKIKYVARAYKAIVASDGSGDYDDIQDAIEYVNGIGGGKIFVKSGDYIMGDDLIIYSDITIEGEDDENTVIDFNSSSYGIVIEGTSLNYKRNIKITRVKIKDCLNYTDGAIYIRYAENIEIEGNIFDSNYSSSAGAGIDIKYSIGNEIKIIGNHFANGGECIVGSGRDNRIKDNYIEEYVVNGIRGVGGESEVKGNYFDYVDGNVIETGVNDGGTMIIGNVINGVDRSGVKTGCGEITCIGNLIDGINSGDYGIIVESYDNYNKIIANHVYRIGGDGINIGAVASRNLISNNTIIGCGGGGINCEGSYAERVVIIGNIIEGNDGKGIRIATGGHYCQINGNVLNANGTTSNDPGISIEGSDSVSVTNNIVTGGSGSGINLYDVTDCIVNGNRCRNNALYGVRLSSYNTIDNMVTSNHLTKNTTGSLDNSGTNTLVANNKT